jgi:cytosine/adenosine deaminase-related metal-dependent hydrolase
MKSMSLKSAVNSYDKYHGSFHDRLHIWFAAGSPRGASINDYSKIGNMAKSRNIGMTMHCAEAPNDNNLYHEHYGCSPLEFCQKANLTSNKTVLAHVVHPDPHPDFQILAETGTTVSHNPTSNCKLGSGISPIPDMLAAGVNVAIGTDGAPCNNTYDMIREMHLTSIVHSGARQKAGAIDPYTILEMATINGARALGLEGSIGTLEVGKKADFVVINPNSLHSTPWDATQVQQGGIDPITVVVHSCSGSDVELVVIDGQIVVEQGQITGFDEKQLMVDARERIASLRKRSGVSARNHTNVNFI